MFVCEQLLIHCAFGIDGSFYCDFSVLDRLCIRLNALNRLGWDEVRVGVLGECAGVRRGCARVWWRLCCQPPIQRLNLINILVPKKLRQH